MLENYYFKMEKWDQIHFVEEHSSSQNIFQLSVMFFTETFCYHVSWRYNWDLANMKPRALIIYTSLIRFEELIALSVLMNGLQQLLKPHARKL